MRRPRRRKPRQSNETDWPRWPSAPLPRPVPTGPHGPGWPNPSTREGREGGRVSPDRYSVAAAVSPDAAAADGRKGQNFGPGAQSRYSPRPPTAVPP